jgi:ribosomal protein S18 acetylase RimI-like enzyme
VGRAMIGGMELAERIAAADRNFVVSFEKLVAVRPGAELRRFGPHIAVDSRLPFRIFNGLAVLQPIDGDQLREAFDWLNRRGARYTVWVREDLSPDVRPMLEGLGFEATEWPEPVMAIESTASIPPPPAGVVVRPVTDRAGLEDHIGSSGMPEDLMRMLYTPAFLGDPEIRLFTAYLDGRAAGTSVAIRSDDVAGVYAVGVPEELRGQGIGTAVTWAAVGAGAAWGSRLVVLQSSELGFGVYRRMGFEVLTRYEMYRPLVVAAVAVVDR